MFYTDSIALTYENRDYEGYPLLQVWALLDGELVNVHAYPVDPKTDSILSPWQGVPHSKWRCEVRWHYYTGELECVAKVKEALQSPGCHEMQ